MNKVAEHLRNFFHFMIRLLKAVWLYIASFISVVVIYALLIGYEQGIDVVIQSGEYAAPGAFAVIALFFWAYIIWFSGRILSYIKQNKDDEIYGHKSENNVASLRYVKYGIPTYFYKHIPRLLSYNCFVAVQLAIFHLPTIQALTGVLLTLGFLLHNSLYFLGSAFLTLSPGKKKRTVGLLALCIIIAYTAFLLFEIVTSGREFGMVVLNSNPDRHQFWLRIAALLTFGLQLLSVLYFVKRRKKIDNAVKAQAERAESSNTPTRKTVTLLRLLGLTPDYVEAEAAYITPFNIVALIGGSFYLAAIFFMVMADRMGPLSFALLAMGVLCGVANFIIVFSIRLSYNVFVILYLIAFINGFIFLDPYKVRMQETGREFVYNNRPTPQTFLASWFNDKSKMLPADTTEKFPVYIILSNGGASRAGKWVSSVLSHLQDDSYKADPDNNFRDHILAIAGASGGTVGNCVFYSLLRESLQNPSLNFTEHSDAFFQSDFLTFTLARLLGPDMIRHVATIPMDDRAAALERLLGNSKDETLNKYFNRSLSKVLDYSGRLPILYINSTEVDNGMPGVISSVKLSEYSPRKDVLALVDSMAKKEGTGDIRLSTAAILSSRFPYVSPAGKVFDRYFVDGGYFDNSGAGTVLELIQELSKFMNHPSNRKIKNRFSFRIIHITNSETTLKSPGDIHPLTNDLLAPVLTLAGMQGASTSISNNILQANFKLFAADTTNALIEYSLYDKDFGKRAEGKNEMRKKQEEKEKYEEGYPMSWVISDYQLTRMHNALLRYKKQEQDWFYFYKKQ